MSTPATMLPLLGLRIQAGPVELRGITDDLIGPLADLAVAGIHDPGTMPFSFRCTKVIFRDQAWHTPSRVPLPP